MNNSRLPSAARGNPMISKDSKNILIADDSIFFRTKLSDILVEAGHKVRFAVDGREVINELKINSNGLDLLVLDLQMPEVDGFGVLEWINGNGLKDKMPVLVITSMYETTEVLDRLKTLGATGFVTKGFPPEQLVFRVNRLLYPNKINAGVNPRDRVTVSAPVDFTIGNITRTGYLLNISDMGVFLHTKSELLPGTMINLKFSLPRTDRLFEVRGVVKRTTHSPSSKNMFGGCGIEFTSISPEDQEALKDFISAEIKRLGIDR